MSASASFMGLLGVGAALLPEQILAYLGTPPEGFPVVLLNVVGVVYLSFGVTVALTQHVTAAPHPTVFVVGTAAYALFAAGFGYVVFAGGQSCG